MRVKFIKSWRNYRVGQQLDNFHDGMATELLRRGIVICVEIEEEKSSKKKKYMVPPEPRHA